MDLKEIHDLVLFQVRKIRHGQVSHPDIDKALHRASLEKFNDLTGNQNQNQPGRPIPINTPQVNDKNADMLSPFLVYKEESPSSGEFKLPSNYACWPTLRILSNGRKIDIVTERELSDLLDSAVCPPTEDEPIARVYSDRVRIYPRSFDERVEISYLRLPVAPVYAESGSGRSAVYSKANSVQLEWPGIVINDIINKAAFYIGEFLNSAEVIQAASIKEQKGL